MCVQCSRQKSSNEKAPPKQPNIIIFLADDLGYGNLQDYGSPNIRTPNIDSLGDQGIRFTSYEAAPWCVPSRAELMTGIYAPRVHFGGGTGSNGHGGMPDSLLTLAEGLKKAGYATGMAGKWHLGWWKTKYLPTNKGFDTWLGLPYSNDYREPYVHADVPLVMYKDTTVIEYPVNEDSLTVKYTKFTKSFIRAHSNKNQPFFFYLAYDMPHMPIHVSKGFYSKSGVSLYADVIEKIDWSVGQVLNTLKKEGIAKNTIVLFQSDNGPWNGAAPRMFKVPIKPEGSNWRERWTKHGPGNQPWDQGTSGPLRGFKHTAWEGGTRVPAMISWPGHIRHRQVSRAIVTNLDMFRTLLKVGGGQLPKYRLDGYNMMPFFTGKVNKDPRNTYAYFINNLLGLRIGDWKLKVGDHGRWLLFNLAQDVGENYNRAKWKPELVKKMKTKMDSVAQSNGVKIAKKPHVAGVPNHIDPKAFHAMYKMINSPQHAKQLKGDMKDLSEPGHKGWKWGYKKIESQKLKSRMSTKLKNRKNGGSK
jgi:arylsulfatase A-like enzyme